MKKKNLQKQNLKAKQIFKYKKVWKKFLQELKKFLLNHHSMNSK
jgi:hypothetical protein